MSRKLLCPACDKQTSLLAEKYSEHYESIKGNANSHYKCDNCDKPIAEGDECFAACLLPNKNHPNYQFQKPEEWALSFINFEW
jgi:hypothetical protein